MQCPLFVYTRAPLAKTPNICKNAERCMCLKKRQRASFFSETRCHMSASDFTLPSQAAFHYATLHRSRMTICAVSMRRNMHRGYTVE